MENTKICTECLVTKTVDEFYKGVGYKDGYRPLCKSCSYKRECTYEKSPRKSQAGTRRPKFHRDKQRAEDNDIQWDLTQEQHLALWNSLCYYCGKSGDGIGIGRKDDSIGFTVDNSIAKCKSCIKGDTKRCNSCGEFKHIKNFGFHYDCRLEKVSTCKECVSIKGGIRYATNKELRYSYYRDNAVKDGKEFSLTLEEFSNFWGNPCYYCGKEISSIGIDRVINTIGYRIDNVVPCCRNCNTVKNEFDLDNFKRISAGVIKGMESFLGVQKEFAASHGGIALKLN